MIDFLIGVFSFFGFVFIAAIVAITTTPWIILITSKYWKWCDKIVKGDSNG